MRLEKGISYSSLSFSALLFNLFLTLRKGKCRPYYLYINEFRSTRAYNLLFFSFLRKVFMICIYIITIVAHLRLMLNNKCKQQYNWISFMELSIYDPWKVASFAYPNLASFQLNLCNYNSNLISKELLHV